jgi:hypothetical protein
MEFSFPWPLSQGEWLAWGSAALTALFGLVLLFAPRLALRMLRLRTADRHPEAVAAVRATMSGFYLGLGVSALLLAQPFLYLALGFSWGVTAFGRIISMLSDRGGGFYNLGFLVLEIALAALPLGFALGLLP